MLALSRASSSILVVALFTALLRSVHRQRGLLGSGRRLHLFDEGRGPHDEDAPAPGDHDIPFTWDAASERLYFWLANGNGPKVFAKRK